MSGHECFCGVTRTGDVPPGSGHTRGHTESIWTPTGEDYRGIRGKGDGFSRRRIWQVPARKQVVVRSDCGHTRRQALRKPRHADGALGLSVCRKAATPPLLEQVNGVLSRAQSRGLSRHVGLRKQADEENRRAPARRVLRNEKRNMIVRDAARLSRAVA
jgi:hypothetical protein